MLKCNDLTSLLLALGDEGAIDVSLAVSVEFVKHEADETAVSVLRLLGFPGHSTRGLVFLPRLLDFDEELSQWWLNPKILEL